MFIKLTGADDKVEHRINFDRVLNYYPMSDSGKTFITFITGRDGIKVTESVEQIDFIIGVKRP
jgi:hypothetical protein